MKSSIEDLLEETEDRLGEVITTLQETLDDLKEIRKLLSLDT